MPRDALVLLPPQGEVQFVPLLSERSVVFSWKVFNLRLGVGYGNYSIPGINLVLPKKTLIPDLDFYFRF